jgi:hypothetical protein
MNLYEIQDHDRPMYVVAESWAAALAAWQAQIKIENNLLFDEIPNPEGIRFVCSNDHEEFPSLIIKESPQPTQKIRSKAARNR